MRPSEVPSWTDQLSRGSARLGTVRKYFFIAAAARAQKEFRIGDSQAGQHSVDVDAAVPLYQGEAQAAGLAA